MRKYYVYNNSKYIVGTYKTATIITRELHALYQENNSILLIECNTPEDVAFIKLFIQGKIDKFEVQL